jgi:murein L,D-transpeptidase YcbB/YkuD
VGGLTISAPLRFEDDLRRFYRARDHVPIWLASTGREGRLDEFLAALRSVEQDGLRSEEYGVAEGAWVFASPGALSATAQAELELHLSDGFLRLAHDLTRGRIDPRSLAGEWSSERERFDAVAILTQVAAPKSASATLARLRPSHPQYRGLRAALGSLRDGGMWLRIPPGGTLKIGESGPRVVSLRARLTQSGDVADPGGPSVDPASFDPWLENAVRAFQRRHGLEPDGVVGAETLRELNVTALQRARQVAANMERWRWLPNDLGERRVIVNVPDFSVTVEDADATTLRWRAIVGRAERETPTFSSVIESFSLAPFWNVPANLARKDILPNIREDSLYLDRVGMTVVDLHTGKLGNGRSIDWATISDDDFLARYRLRQNPGPLNSLGDLKIAFPNPFTVFLHDTPAQKLFDAPSRAFSSGCVRVEQSFELLHWLLDGDPEWTSDRITEVIAGGEEQTSRIREPVPIHVLYLTAVVEEDGRVGFRPDVYGMDGALEQALMSGTNVESLMAEPMFGSCS